MKLQFLGQNGFSFELNGKNIVVDPFISSNPLAKDKIKVDEIKADYVLITHGHFDHVEDAEAIAKKNNATIVTNYEIAEWYKGKGLNAHGMNHGGKWEFDFGTVKYVNAIHSSVLPDGTYGGNPIGFVIWTDDICFYISGDTALTKDMELIPRMCPKLDFAILCIGDNFTMGVDDAIIASEMIDCSKIVGSHFDTFGFIEIDHKEAVSKFEKEGRELLLIEVGKSIEI